jgi:2-isopropylmalate synthase
MNTKKDKIIIFDTTLRDGEQAPGATMTLDQKLSIASTLDDMKVDIIEAGFPVSSEGEFKAVSEISSKVKYSIVAGLARANKNDIKAVIDSTKKAQRNRVHTFISTSPIHMKYKLKMHPEQVLEAINDSVKYARNLCDDVEWSCEDGTRSDEEFLYRCFDVAIKAGASTVNIADTVGYTMPFEFENRIKNIMSNVNNIDKAIFSVHCHNDLGFAVANSIAALNSGVRQLECTINGLGERAGNASLEEIVMTLKTRSDILPYKTEILAEYFTEISSLVSEASGFAVAPNKAIVGKNAFAHESGIHQHGVIVNPNTYEIILPEEVGAGGSKIIMGKHSGRHAFRHKIKELGLDLGDNQLEHAFTLFKRLADKEKNISDGVIINLINSIEKT